MSSNEKIYSLNNVIDSTKSIVDECTYVKTDRDDSLDFQLPKNNATQENINAIETLYLINQKYTELTERLTEQKAMLDDYIGYIKNELDTIQQYIPKRSDHNLDNNNHSADSSIVFIQNNKFNETVLADDLVSSYKPSSGYSIAVFMFNQFKVVIGDQLVDSWINNKSKSIFKYLITHKGDFIHKERLMDLLWPESDPELARNNLNVAIHNLRKTLMLNENYPQIILFRDNAYFINPEIEIWTDYESFIYHYNTGKELENVGLTDQAYKNYKIAESLYQGEYLAEDRYDNWLMPIKQRFTNTYLILADKLAKYHFDNHNYESCIHVCYKSLTIDQCNEEAHRTIMKAYAQLGYVQLAVRQYLACKQILRREVDATPHDATVMVYQNILQKKSA